MSIDPNSRAARQREHQSRRNVSGRNTAGRSTGNRNGSGRNTVNRNTMNYNAANRRRKRKKKQPIWKIVVIVLVLIIGGTVGGAIFYMNHLWNMTADLEVNMEEIQVNPNLDIQTEKVQKGFWKIAVFGVDSTDGNLGKGANSDVIIICNVNRETGEIKMVSIYRDTYLKVGDKNPYRKINEAYARGGPEQALKALNENLDIAVDDFVAVNWKAVADAINNLGGVDIEVTEAEFKQINGYITSVVENTGVYSQHLKGPGFQHLDGVQAVAYCRLRKMDTDFQRTQRQREVISQCLENAKKADLKELHALIGVCLPQVAHSFQINDLLEAAANVRQYHLGETAGFPFDLKIQDIGKLDCVVPETLTSNVVKLHQFLFGTENYQPSSHVMKISEDIAYNSAKQADSGEELRQEDMEKMTSQKNDSEKEEREESSEKESSRETSEQETDEEGNPVSSEPEEDMELGEDPNTQSDEYVPEDELINDPGLRNPEESSSGNNTHYPGNDTENPGNSNYGPGSSNPGSSAGPGGTTNPGGSANHGTTSPGGSGTTSPGGSTNSGGTAGPGENTGPGATNPGGTVNPGGSNGPGGGHSVGPGGNSSNSGTVYETRPVPTETEPTGVEAGPGFF